jgi:hypothetical protein
MHSREIHRRAKSFLADAVAGLKGLPFDTIRAWTSTPNFDLHVPQELLDAKCEFILIKDTLPSGDIEIAVQYRRYRYLGFSQMMADGFVIKTSGGLDPLSQERIWDLT